MNGRERTRREVLAAAGGVGLSALAGCPIAGGGGAAIEVTESALRDETVDVGLTGFESGTEVTVRATSADYDPDGPRWTSWATFEADENGEVALSEQSPTDGTYEGADAMGLFWSMTPVTADGETGPTAAGTPSPTGTPVRTTRAPTGTDDGEGLPEGYDVALRAVVDGETAAAATTTRRYVAEGVRHESVATDRAVGELFLPPGEGPHPGVLVLHGSGGSPWLSMARALASRGYAAFAVQYFDPTGEADPIPDALVEVPLSYFDDARAWLVERSAVADGSVGVVGASKGGEASLLVGAEFDWPGAVVAYAPSCYAWAGIEVERGAGGIRFRQAESSSWARGGDPVPYLQVQGRSRRTADGKYATRPAYRGGVEHASAERRDAAFVPVEETDAPLLVVAGEDDQLWPSAAFGRRVVDRLDAEGVGFEYGLRAYDGAGHSIGVPYTPTVTAVSDIRLAMGGTPAADARAEADSWPRVRDRLGSVSA
ncbi:acyl-CoA thioesterase/bile acid-CoA:amino acid N-acyltransferase family protein [Halosimplex halophilum]|uniref:acyl-CoA thioesterase/bile acid-CoA:amino acid N-acyltransferase family protein n=1 Tax=Halosimplex halophilum TaxID=2559572 RepID=UPI00107F59C3|nr:acyl-CoA thioesterase/bile acid-CoA:amino acid N-acyltransferase family protein [Halosimplex halophilum]